MRIYEVAVAAPLPKTLTYAGPDDGGTEQPVRPGQRVLVPLGRRKVTGYVLAEIDQGTWREPGYEIKPIAESLDSVPLYPESLVPFFRWIADYYHHPLGEVIRTALPGGLSAGSGRRVILTPEGKEALDLAKNKRNSSEEELAEQLLVRGELGAGTVARLWRNAARKALLLQWERMGWITIQEEVDRKQIREKKETVVRLEPEIEAEIIRAAAESPDGVEERIGERFPELKKSERKTLAILADLVGRNPGMPVPQPDVTRIYAGAGKALNGLEQNDLLCREQRRVYRDLFGRQPLLYPKPDRLTAEQQSVLDRVLPAVRAPLFQTFLLQGVTGSGKTEVYMRAAEEALAAGRGVLVLVPEIALASQLEAHFLSRFGDLLALLHSGLSPGERHDQWQRILSGEARVVIGARSALFAPLDQPGLIIVDEEHEPAYKQEDGLRYNARDLAVLRARFAGCPVILGSATPSAISYQNALSGKYILLSMLRRIHDQPLPEVHIVDLREEKSRPDLLFSDRLSRALWENMEKRQQSLLFMNRRGFASFMMCRDCGHIIQCRHCKVSLTMHRGIQRLVCHYCGYSLTAKIACPSCNSLKVEGMGLGSERIEAEVRQLIPHARVARLDSDTVTSRKKYLETLRAVHRQDIDILIGTQMIAKGLHFPNMTLVGVIWADSGLGMPDFRASERTFQLLAQVTGRAGRGEHPGTVIIQTCQPQHYAIRCARQHDYRGFFDREMELRKELMYPPFSRLVNIRFSAANEVRVKECAQQTGKFLRGLVAQKGWKEVEILGPAPAPLERIKDKTRWQILLKSGKPALLHELCSRLQENFSSICLGKISLAIDVDPESMM